MSVYVLDTDHLSLHLRGHQQVRERLALVAFDSSPSPPCHFFLQEVDDPLEVCLLCPHDFRT